MSLIEILSTLGILATLISLLLPSLEYKERAARIKCLSNMRTLGVAFQLYANDNDFIGPPDARDRGNLGLGRWELGSQKVLFGCLSPYLGNDKLRSKVIFCPGMPKVRKAIENEGSVETSYWMTPDVTSNPTKATKLFLIPPRRVAIMDVCYWWNEDDRNNHRGAGFNVFRLDGSASWISKKQAQQAYQWRWSDFDTL